MTAKCQTNTQRFMKEKNIYLYLRKQKGTLKLCMSLLKKTAWQVKCIGIIDKARVGWWLQACRGRTSTPHTLCLAAELYELIIIIPLTLLWHQKGTRYKRTSEIPSNNHLRRVKMKNIKDKKVALKFIKHNTSSLFCVLSMIYKN